MEWNNRASRFFPVQLSTSTEQTNGAYLFPELPGKENLRNRKTVLVNNHLDSMKREASKLVELEFRTINTVF